MISIISCFNDVNIINDMLISSLKKQNISYELILQDNTKNQFKSAAKALNDGIKKATGDSIMIVHQDVEFEENQLEKIVRYINELEKNAIVGVAGVKDSSGVYSNIKQGKEKKYAGQYRVSKPVKVQTLDEVMIASRRSTFEKLPFDENNCDNWHLYGVDICLSGHSENINSYVIPIDLYHKSTGVITVDYYNSLIKVAKKHKNEISRIYTTCSIISTSSFQAWVYVSLRKLKLYIKKFLF